MHFFHVSFNQQCNESYSTWCGPCKASKPQLEALAASYDSDPSINVSCGIAYEHNLGEDIQNYRVRAFPTYALFQKSSEVGRVEGVNFEGIKSLVGQHCKAHDFGSGGAVSAADARAQRLARVKKIGQWESQVGGSFFQRKHIILYFHY